MPNEIPVKTSADSFHRPQIPEKSVPRGVYDLTVQ